MKLHRRDFIKAASFSALSLALPWDLFARHPEQSEGSPTLITKKIPSTGQAIPVIGLGTWITFNVGENTTRKEDRKKIMQEFFAAGGGMIDSSPMYGSAEKTIGYGLKNLKVPPSFFSANKIWSSSLATAKKQIQQSQKDWGRQKFDLYQVHNLDGWEENLPYLFDLKKKGEIRYVGITTSHGRRHADFAKIMRTHPLDFVQLTYNFADREAENLLELAQERKIAVIANRPLDGGDLFRHVKNKPLPAWAAEIDAKNWSQVFLKFVVSHPGVTCAIPATSVLSHLQENMGACRGLLPDANLRKKMVQTWAAL